MMLQGRGEGEGSDYSVAGGGVAYAVDGTM